MKTRSYLILMAAAILIPVLLFSGLGLDMLLQRERESRLRMVEEIARATALAIDQEVAEAEGSLSVFAQTPFFKTEDFGPLYELMVRRKMVQSSWNIVYGYDGHQLVNTVVPFDTSLSTVKNPNITAVIDGQKTHVSNLRFGSLKKVPGIAVSMPVAAPTGKKYLVSQIFRADHFNGMISSPRLSPSWIVGIFGSDGISIARSPQVDEMIGKPVRPDLYQASLKSQSGRTRHVTRDNIAVYSIFTHTERTGWTVAIGVPEAEIEAPARRAAWYAAGAMGLTFVLAASMILLLARRLTRSVDHAVDAARVLGRGGIPEATMSGVLEADVLQAALHDAGSALARENKSRRALEQERELLLQSEQAARMQAEDQNRTKDEFLAMLGHELRNPLAPISTAAQILKMAGADPKRIKLCSEIIERQVGHLIELVNDLLDVSRVTRGLVELDKKDIDLQLVIDAAVEQAQPLIDARRHALVTELDALPARVHGDLVRLVQVLVNLLNNAAKYTPEGGCIRLSTKVLQTQVRIEVSDNGIGIEPALLLRVFDLFTQAERTPERSQGGLGLGLALVKSLMTLHGGQVQAFSGGTGQGSTFTLHLARVQPQAR